LCLMMIQPPSPKRWQSPQFSAHVHCGKTAAWIKMPLGTEIGLGPDDIASDGDPALPPEKGGGTPSPIFGPCLLWPNGWMDQDCGGRAPQFSSHFYCGQTAACININMPLGMEVGLSADDFVLHGDLAPSPKRAEPPNFRPMSIVANRLHGSRCHLVRR